MPTSMFETADPPAQFSAVAKLFHWLVALLMLSVLSVAFSFAWIPPAERAGAIPVHVSIGLIILILTIIRLAYRRVVAPPATPVRSPGWMKRGARIGHFLLYALIFVQAALGIWMAAASPVGISFFNSLNLSALAAANPDLLAALRPLHFAGACAFVLVLVGHVSAALWHHFRRRDDVLVRMLPLSGLWQREAARTAVPDWRFPSRRMDNWPKGQIR